MERHFDCVECGCEEAELKLEERTESNSGKTIRVVGVPFYLCPKCGEATYIFKVELAVEKLIDEWMKKGDSNCTVNIAELFNHKHELSAALSN